VEVFKSAGRALFVDAAAHFNKVLAAFADSPSASSDKTTN